MTLTTDVSTGARKTVLLAHLLIAVIRRDSNGFLGTDPEAVRADQVITAVRGLPVLALSTRRDVPYPLEIPGRVI
jgi:hypothetical protein